LATQKLTAKAVEALSFSGKQQKVSDGGGLHLLVASTGKYWRYSFRYEKKQQTLALGVYPVVSLKNAREKHQVARALLASGVNPSEGRRQEKLSADSDDTFESVAVEWLSKNADWADSHKRKVEGRLKKDVYPYIGKQSVRSLKVKDLLNLLYRIEERGAVDSAHRVRQTLSSIFCFAIQTGTAEYDPIPNTKGALKSAKSKQYPFISDPKK